MGTVIYADFKARDRNYTAKYQHLIQMAEDLMRAALYPEPFPDTAPSEYVAPERDGA